MMRAHLNLRHLVFCGLFLLASFANTVSAENVRGRLDGVGPYGVYPVSRVAVTLFSQAAGRSSPAYSDYQGMYYIYNVPPGDYTLEVWAGGAQPMIFDIFVIPNRPVTDIAPIRVR